MIRKFLQRGRHAIGNPLFHLEAGKVEERGYVGKPVLFQGGTFLATGRSSPATWRWGSGICSKQPNPRPMPFFFMTHSGIEDSATVDIVFPTSGIPVVLKSHGVPTEDLEKLPRWLLEKSSDERVK